MSMILLNRTQLARHLAIAPKTLALRIKAGLYVPHSHDAAGRPLFAQPNAKRQIGGRAK